MLKRLSFLALVLSMAISLPASTTAQDLSTAEGILRAHVEATGGEKAWAAVEDMYAEIQIEAGTPMGPLTLEMKTWSIFPGYGYTEMNLLNGPDGIPAEAVNMKAYYTPLEGWMEQGGQRQDMANVNPQMTQQFMRTSPKQELELLSNEEVTLALKGDSTFDDRAVYVIGVTMAGTESDMMIDKETLMILGQSTSTPMGDVVTRMSGYEEVDGLMFSMGQSAESAQGTQKVTIKKVELNSGLTPGAVATKAGTNKRVMPE